MSVTYNRDTGQWDWQSTRSIASGTATSFHEARFLELYDEMRHACMGLLIRHELENYDELIDLSIDAVKNKLDREPDLARNTDGWIRYRAMLYLRARICKRMKTLRNCFEVSYEGLLSPSFRRGPVLAQDAPIDPIAIGDTSAIDAANSRLTVQDILALLERPSHRLIVRMLMDDATQEEIASVLQVTSAAVRAQLKTIRSRLEACGAREMLLAA